MNTTPNAAASPNTTLNTAQTVLLMIASVAGTWLGLYRVPWQFSGDPCLLGAAAAVIVAISLWATRWGQLRAVRFERNVIAVFLVLMPLVYVTRYWFTSAGGVSNLWFWIEVLGTATFVILAVLGGKRSPWFLAIGMILHGLAWDSWHYGKSTYIPNWYVFACLVVDLTFGAYVAARVPAYRRASRI